MFELKDNPEENYVFNPPLKENQLRRSSKSKQTLNNKTKIIIQKATYNARSQPIGEEIINYSKYLQSLAQNG